MPLPIITKKAEAPWNVRGRMDEPMPSMADLTLQDVPINLSTLSRVYMQIKNTARKNYGAVALDA